MLKEALGKVRVNNILAAFSRHSVHYAYKLVHRILHIVCAVSALSSIMYALTYNISSDIKTLLLVQWLLTFWAFLRWISCWVSALQVSIICSCGRHCSRQRLCFVCRCHSSSSRLHRQSVSTGRSSRRLYANVSCFLCGYYHSNSHYNPNTYFKPLQHC